MLALFLAAAVALHPSQANVKHTHPNGVQADSPRQTGPTFVVETPAPPEAHPCPRSGYTKDEDEVCRQTLATEAQVRIAKKPIRQTWILIIVGGVQSVALILTLIEVSRATRYAGHSARVAERALSELERPYLVVDFGEAWGVSFKDGKWIFGDTLNFKATNLGRAPAILKRHYAEGNVAINGVLKPVVPAAHRGGDLPNGAAVGNGRSEVFTHRIVADLDLTKLPNNVDAKNAVTITGFVVYEDLLGNEYTRGYCAACVGDRWFLLGGPDYCYERVKPNNYA